MFKKCLDNNNFLWVTRGEKWGFRFLSKCSSLSPYIDTTIYKALFLCEESRFGYWEGIISFNDGRRIPYVACRCYDDSCVQQDEAGRRIPHEFLLLCSYDEVIKLSKLSWGPLLLNKVRDYYANWFHCLPTEINPSQFDICIEFTSEIDSCESCIRQDIFVHSYSTPISSPNPRFNKYFYFCILGFSVVVCIILFCFLQGKAKKPQRACDNHFYEEKRVIQDSAIVDGSPIINPLKQNAEKEFHLDKKSEKYKK